MPTAGTEWRCSGCGIAAPDRVRRCDCVTNVLYIYDGKKMVHEVKLDDPAIRQCALMDAAKVCRDKYCEIIPGKRTWADLTEREREIDAICLDAAIAAFSDRANSTEKA